MRKGFFGPADRSGASVGADGTEGGSSQESAMEADDSADVGTIYKLDRVSVLRIFCTLVIRNIPNRREGPDSRDPFSFRLSSTHTNSAKCEGGAPSRHGVDLKAIDAVMKFRFKPAMKDNTPVPVNINVEISFRLNNH